MKQKSKYVLLNAYAFISQGSPGPRGPMGPSGGKGEVVSIPLQSLQKNQILATHTHTKIIKRNTPYIK